MSSAVHPSSPRGASAPRAMPVMLSLLGAFLFVELTSGILQGYYIPLISKICQHLGIAYADYNWFEAAQLLLSALAVPILSRLGDIYGHKRILIISTAVTAVASWSLVFASSFPLYLIAFAFQGFYVVWLPLEVALIFDRGRRSGRAASVTRQAAAYLIVALQAGAIAGALAGAALFEAFGGNIPLTLSVPAIAVTICLVLVVLFVRESERHATSSVDTAGFALLALALLGITSSLSFLHLNGLGCWWAWLIMAAGIAMIFPFIRHVRGKKDPAIDLKMLARPTMWPIQATALLGGVSLLGGQIPLSTFAATDPATAGFGLGLAPGPISYITGGYLVSIMVGALLLPVLAKRLSAHTAIMVFALTNAVGFLLFLLLHHTTGEVMLALYISGVGSGGMIAALPAFASAAAPAGQAGIAAGLTNTAKTLGGAFASAVFGMILHNGATGGTTSSLASYLWVWGICGATALAAFIVLLAVPRGAFSDSDVDVTDVVDVTDDVDAGGATADVDHRASSQ